MVKKVTYLCLILAIAPVAFGGVFMRKGYFQEYVNLNVEAFPEGQLEIELESMGYVLAEWKGSGNIINRGEYGAEYLYPEEAINKLLEKDRKIKITGNPYVLALKFSSKKKYKNIQLRSLKLINLDNQKNILNIVASKTLEAKARGGSFFSSFIYWDELKNIKIDYVDYRVEMSYEVCLDGSGCQEYEVNKTLRKKYEEKKSFDFIEAIKGV